MLRRRAEAVLGALPLLAVLCIPILVARRSSWVSARAIAYWAVWLAFGEALRHVWRTQDVDADPAISARLRTISAVGIPLTGLALTFAAFDWMMALNPGWTSSVYGGYYFAGAMVSALALMTLLASKVARTNDEPRRTAEHFQALRWFQLAIRSWRCQPGTTQTEISYEGRSNSGGRRGRRDCWRDRPRVTGRGLGVAIWP